MPAMKYMINQFPYITFHIWVPDYFHEFAKNLLPVGTLVKPFSEKDSFSLRASRKYSGIKAYTNLRTHLTDHAFHVFANESPSIEHKNYLQLNLNKINIKYLKLPEKYVVICTGFTANIREFLPQYINEIVRYVIEKGYTPVFLGKKQSALGADGKVLEGYFKEEIDYSKGINLIDKTTLCQAGKIIAGAKCIVGLDNGLLHVAGCTNVPIVGGFTSVDPLHRMPYRNNILGWNFYPVVPPDSEPEKFFQSKFDFLFDHDYREPFLKNDSLIKSLKPEMYIEQMEKIL